MIGPNYVPEDRRLRGLWTLLKYSDNMQIALSAIHTARIKHAAGGIPADLQSLSPNDALYAEALASECGKILRADPAAYNVIENAAEEISLAFPSLSGRLADPR